MNYFAPFSLSIFIHFGLVLSFSNFFNIDFNNFNIEASKPIETYLIFEEEKNFPKKKQYIILFQYDVWVNFVLVHEMLS